MTHNCQMCGVEIEKWKYCSDCDVKAKKIAQKKWLETHREDSRAHSLKYHRNNREKVAEQHKRWKAANPEKVAAKQHRNYERYKEKRLAQGKQWVKDHPEETNASRRVRNHNRRARVAQAEGKWTFKEFQELCEASDNHCYYCHKKSDKLTADHMTPLARGGSNGIENIVPVCGSCNSAKGTSTLLEYFYPKARNLPVVSWGG